MQLLNGFLRHCRIHPRQTALIQDDTNINYQQLHNAAEKIACLLHADGKPSGRVAIALERGIKACTAIFGTLLSGNCYVPLDIKNPPNRMQFIIHDADVKWVLGQGACPAWLNDEEKWLDIDALPYSSHAEFKMPGVDAEQLAAILYTSGSTGQPKGVALSHRAIHNFTAWAEQTFSISAADKIASLAPFHFDLSTFDLFASVNAGATVNFIPEKLTLSPSRLTAWLAEQQISRWYTVPSILSFITFKGGLEKTRLPKLCSILFAGEVFKTDTLIKLTRLLPDTDFFNLFGPTETNVCCYWPIDRERLQPDQAIPIGKPAANAKLSIDKQTSELIVNSANNFSGYWQQGRLQPLADHPDGYKTGDKVSLSSRGEYLFHGRLNRMLKCAGYRVEPAEIEQLLAQTAGVADCVVVGIDDQVGGQRPAAALVLKSGYHLKNLIPTIRSQLPAYMLPAKFLELSQLPCLSNGKIDYLCLQQQMESKP